MLFCSLFHFSTLKKILRNDRGQGLIEYLVIVALVGVATIGIMRVVGSAVTHRFNDVASALGEGTRGAQKASASTLKSKDLTSFIEGAKSSRSGKADSASLPGDDEGGQ